MFPLEHPKNIGLIGTGSVGCGWAAIYVARGYKVIASDPAPDAETRARAFIADTWEALRKLGIATSERVPEDSLTFVRITRRGRSRGRSRARECDGKSRSQAGRV